MYRAYVLLAVALAFCACKTPTPPARKGLDAEQQALLGKLHGYIECIATHSREVFRYADRYRRAVAGKSTVTEADLMMFPTPDPAVCLEEIDTVRTKMPRMLELEREADAFGAALKSIYQLTSAGHARLNPNSSLHDPKKAIELHPRLMDAFSAFDKAQAALFDRVFKLNHEAHIRQLAAREKAKGRNLSLISEYLATNAEALVPLAAVPADAFDRVDLPTLEARIRALEASIEEMSSYRLAHPKEAETWESIQTLFDAANQLVIAAKQLAHRVREKLPYTASERLMIAADNESAVVGSPGAVIQAYNLLVQLM